MKNKIYFFTQAAMIAAIYVVLTLIPVIKVISFGSIQCRIAEALNVLTFFTPAAIPGVTIGCLFANILGGAHILDIVFGTIATLIGAVISYRLRNHKWLVPVPAIVSNTIIIPFVLKTAYMEAAPIPFLMLTVGIGEVLAVYVLGTMLLNALIPLKGVIFKYAYESNRSLMK